MTNPYSWKYAMILVHIDEDGGEICELVELYANNGVDYNSFCKAELSSPRDLELAMKDVSRDGINRHFYDSGKFTLIKDEWARTYDWSKS